MRAHELEYDWILCGASPKPGTGCLGVFGGWGGKSPTKTHRTESLYTANICAYWMQRLAVLLCPHHFIHLMIYLI